MKKTLLVVFAVVLLCGAGALWYLYSSMDALVEKAIEHYGSRLTGTSVEVASVSISLKTGRGTIRGLQVGNPEGFSAGNAFSLGEITLQIDAGTLLAGPVVVEEVRIDAPAVSYELDGRGRSNLDVIRTRAEGARQPSPAPSGSGGEEASRLFLVRQFTFERGRLRADASALGAEVVTTELPPLRLENLGAPGGATAERIGREVLLAFAAAAGKAAARKELERELEKKIGGDAVEAGKTLLRKVFE